MFFSESSYSSSRMIADDFEWLQMTCFRIHFAVHLAVRLTVHFAIRCSLYVPLVLLVYLPLCNRRHQHRLIGISKASRQLLNQQCELCWFKRISKEHAFCFGELEHLDVLTSRCSRYRENRKCANGPLTGCKLQPGWCLETKQQHCRNVLQHVYMSFERTSKRSQQF